jgi:protein-S-isoprenylcysteine O-methyltransferase Ste14
VGEDAVTAQETNPKAYSTEEGPSPVLARITDLLFACVAAYLLLGYALALLRPVSVLSSIRVTFFAIYLLMALGFLTVRNHAHAFTTRKVDYLYTILGFSAPVFFQPSSYGGPPFVGALLEFVGAGLVAGAFLSLNRSFGLAPENRGIRTTGVYKFVRHPMYLGYVLAEGGFIVTDFSAFNLAVLTISLLFLLLRLRSEERLLGQDRMYRDYSERTRWKLIPFLF